MRAKWLKEHLNCPALGPRPIDQNNPESLLKLRAREAVQERFLVRGNERHVPTKGQGGIRDQQQLIPKIPPDLSKNLCFFSSVKCWRKAGVPVGCDPRFKETPQFPPRERLGELGRRLSPPVTLRPRRSGAAPGEGQLGAGSGPLCSVLAVAWGKDTASQRLSNCSSGKRVITAEGGGGEQQTVTSGANTWASVLSLNCPPPQSSSMLAPLHGSWAALCTLFSEGTITWAGEPEAGGTAPFADANMGIREVNN